jgi:hypothetical protein
MLITAMHNGVKSTRIPNIVLARDAFELGDTASCQDYAFKTAANIPTTNFHSKDLVLFAEFERMVDKLALPHTTYNTELTKPISPQQFFSEPHCQPKD